MSKKSFFGKKQIVLAGLVVALAAAVWLNMEYSSGAGGFVNTASASSVKNLGDTKYVMNETSGESAAESDYFTTARSERETARNEAISLLKETAENVKADESAKEQANKTLSEIALRMEKESAIETLIKSKGFADAVAGKTDAMLVNLTTGAKAVLCLAFSPRQREILLAGGTLNYTKKSK